MKPVRSDFSMIERGFTLVEVMISLLLTVKRDGIRFWSAATRSRKLPT